MMMSRLRKGETIRDFVQRTKNRNEKRKAKRSLLAKQQATPVRINIKDLVQALDDAHSIVVRIRDKKRYGGICPICNKRPIQVAYHLVPKCTGNYRTRWHDENVIGACCSCNQGERFHRVFYREKHIKLFGLKLMNELEKLGRGASGMNTPDLQALLQDFKDRIAGRRGTDVLGKLLSTPYPNERPL